MICDPCLDRTPGQDEAAATLCRSFSEARRLHALMDFETELGFYTASFILICFRLPPLKITASLWQTNAPGAKISSSTAAIAHRARAGALRKKSFQRRRRQSGERPRGADSHTAIHQPSAPHTAPPAALTRKERRSGGLGEGGLMELYGHGQPCQYIERFTTLLSKGLVRPWLRHSEAPGGVWRWAGDRERFCCGTFGDNGQEWW